MFARDDQDLVESLEERVLQAVKRHPVGKKAAPAADYAAHTGRVLQGTQNVARNAAVHCDKINSIFHLLLDHRKD